VVERQKRWHLWLDRWTSRWVSRYVCVSEAVARFSHQKGGLPAHKLVVIPNAIEVREYPVSQAADLAGLGIPRGRQVVTYVGRLDRQKNVAWLVENGPLWLEELPDCDLLLVGRGPQQAALQRLAQQVGIGDRVHWAGFRDDVPAILAASRLLVLPSRWEGMPNVVLEAMAGALPVVGADVEGVAELLGPAAEEQTVSASDAQAFAAKVVRLVRDTAAAADLGRRNRRRAEERFGIDRMVVAYEQLWEGLISTDGAG
jgi:glycosyltransferase involved in cell wall biosynthesis